jgi:hypothetical protein
MPPGYWQLEKRLEAMRIEHERMKGQTPASNVGAIYALVGLGCLAIIIAIVLERM